MYTQVLWVHNFIYVYSKHCQATEELGYVYKTDCEFLDSAIDSLFLQEAAFKRIYILSFERWEYLRQW